MSVINGMSSQKDVNMDDVNMALKVQALEIFWKFFGKAS